MANKRLIYQDFFEDDYFGTVEIGLRMLWVGLIISAADDQGRILDNSTLIKSKVFMYDSNVTDEQIFYWLIKLCEDGKIIRYEIEGKNLIQIANWWEYQIPSWVNKSKYPPPKNWVDRVRCHVKGGKIKMINWDKEGGMNYESPNELPNELPNDLDSILSNDQTSIVDRPINEIKDEDKYEYESEDEEKEKYVETNNLVKDSLINKLSDDLFNSCREVYETKKGKLVTDGKAFSIMINNFIEHGVTSEDYSAAINAMDADNKYSGTKPTSYETWAINYAKKQNKPQNTNNSREMSINEQTDIVIRELVDES